MHADAPRPASRRAPKMFKRITHLHLRGAFFSSIPDGRALRPRPFRTWKIFHYGIIVSWRSLRGVNTEKMEENVCTYA
jgi:hypothetical protein